MNRDKSTETAAEAKGEQTKETTAAPSKDPRKMIANQTDVAMGKRVAICKASRRFERYGLVRDGQDIVRLAADIAGSVEGKDVEIEVTRHAKGKS